VHVLVAAGGRDCVHVLVVAGGRDCVYTILGPCRRCSLNRIAFQFYMTNNIQKIKIFVQKHTNWKQSGPVHCVPPQNKVKIFTTHGQHMTIT
jgi:tRNA U54 and U55 pseudouridine synthase Pus10